MWDGITIFDVQWGYKHDHSHLVISVILKRVLPFSCIGPCSFASQIDNSFRTFLVWFGKIEGNLGMILDLDHIFIKSFIVQYGPSIFGLDHLNSPYIHDHLLLRLGYWFSDCWRREHVSRYDHSCVTLRAVERSVKEKWIWMMCVYICTIITNILEIVCGFKHVEFYQHLGKWSMMTTLRFSVSYLFLVGFVFWDFLCTWKPNTNWTCVLWHMCTNNIE